MRFHFLLIVASVALGTGRSNPPPDRIVIDVHMHAGPAKWGGPGMPATRPMTLISEAFFRR